MELAMEIDAWDGIFESENRQKQHWGIAVFGSYHKLPTRLSMEDKCTPLSWFGNYHKLLTRS